MTRTASVGLILLLLAPLARAQTVTPAPAPIPPSEAAAHMTVPEGFNVSLFAGEPDVVQPIAFCTDDRGRLWVGECLSYPQWDQTGALAGPDRIVVFEDTTGSGHFDKKTVFADNLANLSGFQLGFGGVYVCSTPHLLFYPCSDLNADHPAPSGPPQVLLDGWNVKTCQHNVFNRLTWGPDGWLWGLNGIQSKSNIGKPGTPDDQRTYFDCGVWRYHPITHAFEVIAWGTTNPWGLDFDDYGQGFITNCVINHLWHVIPGAHFQRMYGKGPGEDTYVYEPMKPCADHEHFIGPWTESRSGTNRNPDAGGGHAHVGAMVYLGDNWPDSYRNSIFMCNLHGARVNNDLLEQHGSGYVGRHGKDFLFANDSWFRGIDLHYGPDGGVYMSDWTDTGECHNHVIVDRTNGRIYKITYGKPATAGAKVDLAGKSDAELVALQLNKNDWFVQHARTLLEERFAGGKLDPGTRPALLAMLKQNPDVTRKLRALWCLHATGGVDDATTSELLASTEPYLRGWAIQLALEGRKAAPDLLVKLADLARADPAPAVRLFLASALQRLPVESRWPIAKALIAHGEDAPDKDLPLMDWYGTAELVPADPARAAQLIATAKIPLVRQYLARRLASLTGADGLAALLKSLSEIDAPEVQSDVMHGMDSAFAGQRHVAMPPAWPGVYPKLAKSPDAYVRFTAKNLALTFGDADALAQLRGSAADKSVAATERAEAVDALVHARDPQATTLLNDMVSDPALVDDALKGLTEVADDKTPGILLDHYAGFSDEQKRAAVNVLASKPAFAMKLLDAIEAGTVAHKDVNAFTVRQLVALNDKPLTARVEKTLGVARPTAKDKAADIARFKKELSPDVLSAADARHGRLVFSRTCAVCHTMFDAGGNVGPNLTGSQRQNLDYLLENIIDPSAIVAKDYYMTLVDTKDDRTITGIIKEESDAALVLRTPSGDMTIPKAEIEKRKTQPISLMPEGLLQGLKPDEVRDLVDYLQSSTQVELPKP
jgi:putative membrane-bound dehydrogenase-like protein